MLQDEETQFKTDNNKKKGYFKIDWGRQGSVAIAYIIVLLGYYGIIANVVMVKEWISLTEQTWISFTEMDRTMLFWTYQIYFSAELDPTIFTLILITIMTLIIIFSLKDWHSFPILSILIVIFIVYILDIYRNLFNIINVITTGITYFNIQGFSIILVFFVCFGLTYKEDLPHYGIKASIWLVPLLIVEAFIFYTIMFGFSFDPMIFQFGSGEGYINLLLLSLTVLSGSLSGMKVKQLIKSKRKI